MPITQFDVMTASLEDETAIYKTKLFPYQEKMIAEIIAGRRILHADGWGPPLWLADQPMIINQEKK